MTSQLNVGNAVVEEIFSSTMVYECLGREN